MLATSCTSGREFPVGRASDDGSVPSLRNFADETSAFLELGMASRMQIFSPGVYALPDANALGRLQCTAELFQ